MATLSTVSCVTGAKNTGRSGCPFDPKNFVGVLLCPPNFVIPAAQLATLQAYLLAQSEVDTKALRIYPVADFFDFKDSSEAPVVEKFGYGQSSTVRDGVYDWAFRYRLGGLNLSNRLRTHNGAYDWYIFIDSKNQLLGTAATDLTGAASIGAIPPIELYADPFKPNDGKKNSEYWVNFRFLPKYVNEFVAYITDAGFDVLSSITGLKDVALTGVGSATPGTYVVTPIAGDDKTNMASLLPVAILQTAAWKAYNTETGAAVTITGVTLATSGLAVNVACTVTSPPYPGVGQHISIDLVGPTELAALATPIVGYESAGAVSIAKN
jgi:hypothetical protein